MVLRNLASAANAVLPRWVIRAVKKLFPSLVRKLSTESHLVDIDGSVAYKFVYHCGESAAYGSPHLQIWLPVFLRYKRDSGLDFILLVRRHSLYAWTRKNYPTVNVVYTAGLSQVSEFLQQYSGIRLVLYSSLTGNNLHLIRNNDLRHVFIGHGDSEKSASAHKGLRVFDELWTAGDAHIDRFKNLSVNFSSIEFKRIGSPRLKQFFPPRVSCDLDSKGTIRALYLPTWEGVASEADYSSAKHVTELARICAARKNFVLDVKFHPCTGNRDPAYRNYINIAKRMRRTHDNFNVLNCNIDAVSLISNYDLFICDVSSVVTDCLVTSAPIFLYQSASQKLVVAQSNMPFQEYCYLFSDFDQLLELITEVVDGKDRLRKNRLRALDYFVGVRETEDDVMLEELMARVSNEKR